LEAFSKHKEQRCIYKINGDIPDKMVNRSVFQRMQAISESGKCQSTNFDAQIATTSLCLMNYISLAPVKRIDDYESIGNIFLHQKDLIVKDHMVKKIWNLIITIYTEVLAQLGVDLDIFLHAIISSQNIKSQHL
jgi:hypothetical protein